jgi:hypothetical protein
MHPELIRQMVLDRTARLQRDAELYRQARETHIRPPKPVRTAIELRLIACREKLERLARRPGAAGSSTE